MPNALLEGMVLQLSFDDPLRHGEVLSGIVLRRFGVVAVEKGVQGFEGAQQLGGKRTLELLAVGVGAADGGQRLGAAAGKAVASSPASSKRRPVR